MGGDSCCYWGCGSVANRVVWACIALAVVLGAGLLGAGSPSVVRENIAYNNCVDSYGGYGAAGSHCYNMFSSWAWPVTIGGVCLLSTAVLSLSWFCCCSRRCMKSTRSGSVLQLPLTESGCNNLPVGNPVAYTSDGIPAWSVKGTMSEKLYVEGLQPPAPYVTVPISIGIPVERSI